MTYTLIEFVYYSQTENILQFSSVTHSTFKKNCKREVCILTNECKSVSRFYLKQRFLGGSNYAVVKSTAVVVLDIL